MQPDETIKDYKIRLFRNKSIYNLTTQTIADLINKVAGTNFNESTFRKWWAIYSEALEDCKNTKNASSEKDKNISEVSKYRSSVEYKNGNVVSDKLIEICENEEMTPEVLMQKHGLDFSKWNVVSYKNNYWHSQTKGGVQTVMYQSKITVKPSIEELSMKTLKEHFDLFDRNYSIKSGSKRQISGDNALILPIADLHYGRYSSAIVSGEKYDMDIAEQGFFDVINDVITYSKDKKIEKVYFPIGNDLLNSDGISGTTQKGTHQDNSGLWQEIVLRCQEMVIKGIEMIKNEIGNVSLFYIKSNHDTQTSFQMYQYIAAWFRNDESIEVSQNYTDYNFIMYGNGIYGFAHNVKKKDNVHKLFDTYARHWLSSTKHREFFLAHLHTEMQVYDNGGTVIRRLPTIAVPCKWSHENAFVGNTRRSQSFLINNKYGITDIHYTVLD